MEKAILKIKISLPPLDNRNLRRPQLVNHLNQSFSAETGNVPQLLLIAAPAGYGKTTLARIWIESNRPCTAWFSLDQQDNQRDRFWLYFLSSIQRVLPRSGKASLALLRSAFMSAASNYPIEALLTPLLNELFELRQRLILVLDDYHLIESSDIHQDVRFFIEQMPPQMILVVTTRSEPPWPLAKWRSRNRLVDIRQRDLQLSRQETDVYFETCKSIKLSDAQLDILFRKTEGWITGLQLAAFSMHKSSDLNAYVENLSASQKQIFQFLSQEVLQQIPADSQNMLRQLSILTRFNCSVSDAVTERTDSSQVLAYFEKENLFIVPAGDSGDWYRFHPLFADMLSRQLRTRALADEICRLHERAADWFLSNLDSGEAIRHYRMSQNTARIAAIFDTNLEDILQSEGPRLFLDSFGILSGTWLSQYPRLLAYKAWFYLIHSGKEAALACLKQADVSENNFKNDSQMPDEIKGMLAVVFTYLNIYDHQMEQAIRHAETAWKRLPELNQFWKTSIAIISGDARLFSARPKQAYPYYLEANLGNQRQGHHYFTISSGFKLATTLYFMGQTDEAEKLVRRLLRLARDEGFSQVSRTGLLWTLLGEIMREHGEFDEAGRCVQRGLLISEAEKPSLAWNLLFRIRLALSEQKYQEGLKFAEEIRSIDEQSGLPRFILLPAAALRVRLFLAMDLIDQARQIIENTTLSVTREPEPGQTHLYFASVHLFLMETKDREKADKQLAETQEQIAGILASLIETLTEEAYLELIVEGLLLQARLVMRGGRKRAAALLLKKAFSQALSTHRVQIVVDNSVEDADLAALYRQILSDLEVTSQKEKENLLILKQSLFPEARINEKTDSISDGVSQSAADSLALIEPLSDREQEVLHLISQGMTNKTISERLYLSPGTIKWYTSQLYSKLGVSSRTEAALLARQLDL